MKITSPAFIHNGYIPLKYTCDGENINPPLVFSNVPKESKSLVLVVYDPDVPRSIRKDGMWVHWIIFNMSPDTAVVEEGIEPYGTYGITTSNTLEYVGPCPPDREHRYFFKLYALDTTLNLADGADKNTVVDNMQGHIIKQAELVGKYERK